MVFFFVMFFFWSTEGGGIVSTEGGRCYKRIIVIDDIRYFYFCMKELRVFSRRGFFLVFKVRERFREGRVLS